MVNEFKNGVGLDVGDEARLRAMRRPGLPESA